VTRKTSRKNVRRVNLRALSYVTNWNRGRLMFRRRYVPIEFANGRRTHRNFVYRRVISGPPATGFENCLRVLVTAGRAKSNVTRVPGMAFRRTRFIYTAAPVNIEISGRNEFVSKREILTIIRYYRPSYEPNICSRAPQVGRSTRRSLSIITRRYAYGTVSRRSYNYTGR